MFSMDVYHAHNLSLSCYQLLISTKHKDQNEGIYIHINIHIYVIHSFMLYYSSQHTV